MNLNDIIKSAYFIQKDIDRSYDIREWFFKNFKRVKKLPSHSKPDQYLFDEFQINEILTILSINKDDLPR